MKAVEVKRAVRYLISGSGIIIGLAVLMIIVGIAEGGRTVLKDNFWRNGLKVYDIEFNDMGLSAEEYLRPQDERSLTDKMTEIKCIIPVRRLEAKLMSYKASDSVTTLAVNEKYHKYANLKMLKGSFINEQDVKKANKIAVIDELTALELFGTTDIEGQKLTLQVSGRKVEFAVAGVFKNFNKNIETLFDGDIPGLCLIPDSVPLDVSFEYRMEKLIAFVDNNLHEEEVKVKLTHLLEKEYGLAGVYSISEYEQLPEVLKFTDKYMVFAVIIALAGFITGGIGVMNAMLLTIHERKKEIGLYRLYGSEMRKLQYDIVYRILIICLGCGMLGLVSGLLAGNFIGSFFNINAKATLIPVSAITAAMAFVGITSSLYPAYKVGLVDASETIWEE